MKLCSLKGRLGSKHYLKDKRTKWGSRCLCWRMLQIGTSKVFKYIRQARQYSSNGIGVCSKGVLDLRSGLENSGNSIGVCSKGVLDLRSGLENSGNSIGVCSKGVLDLMSGLENSGNSIGVCSKGVLDSCLA